MAPTYTRSVLSSSINAQSSTVQAINALGRPRDVSALVDRLDPLMVPLQQAFGKGDSFANPTKEWTDERFGAITATVSNNTYDSSAGTVTIVLASGHGARVMIYDRLITAGGETIWVTNVSTDTLTVVRGFGGSTRASIAANSTLKRIGPAVPEKVAVPGAITSRGEFYTNYVQQFARGIEVSYLQQNTDNRYLVKGKEYSYEAAKQMKEILRDFERTLIYGTPQAADSTNPWAMGGFLNFITQHVLAKAGGILTEANFLDTQQAAWDDVQDNMGLTIFCNMFTKRIFSGWADELREADATQTRVVMKVDTIENDFGVFDFVISGNMPSDTYAVINPENELVLPYNGMAWTTQKISNDRLSEEGVVYGAYTLEAHGDRAHSKVSGYSTTSTDYPTMQTR